MKNIIFWLTLGSLANAVPYIFSMQNSSSIPSLCRLAARSVSKQIMSHSNFANLNSISADLEAHISHSPEEMHIHLKEFFCTCKNEDILQARRNFENVFSQAQLERQRPFINPEEIDFSLAQEGSYILEKALSKKRQDIIGLLRNAGMTDYSFKQTLHKLIDKDNAVDLESFLKLCNVDLKDKFISWPLLIRSFKESHYNGNKNCKSVKQLLAHGCDANAREDMSGETALMLASYKNCVPCASALIKYGAKLEAQDDKGQTAIIHAATSKQVDSFRMLLEAGANTNVQYKDKNLFEYAKEYRLEEILRLLRIIKEEKESKQ